MYEACFHFKHKDGWLSQNKRRIMVITSYKFSSNSKGKVEDEEQASSNHIIVRETDDLEAEVETAIAPKTLENEGQATVVELKELHLGSEEDPFPIYVSTMLTLDKEKEYFSLISEYKDVFA